MINELNNNEIRNICKERLESLEYWLRRLVNEKLSAAYGDYFSYVDGKGNRLIRGSIVSSIEERIEKEPERYSRKVDAVLLADAIDIICNPRLYNAYFKEPLKAAFPEGRDEARTFMIRLLDPRNSLAHANPISMRQAEQIICYSGDIMESLKEYYRREGMNREYNVPLILKVVDSFGNIFYRHQMQNVYDSGIMKMLDTDPKCVLWPGDTLTIEVEVDPSFSPEEYSVIWYSVKGFCEPIPNGCKAAIKITSKQVGQQFDIQCRILSNKDWHRMHIGIDDILLLYYKVLPLR